MSTAAEGEGLLLDVGRREPAEAVAELLRHAADRAASDLFFHTNEDHVAVAARHLGVLRPVGRLPLEHGRHCLAHVKAVARMDVAERRRPQDGRWLFRHPATGRAIDLRVNTVPTLYGEDMGLRLLERETRLLTLEQLGLPRHDYNRLVDLLNRPGGLILVSGPTGSGKTTTLYACLAHLNDGRRKINTIEDPVEYALEGVRQSQVNPRLDVGFPELLRAVLRQAPDVIMIGEIRDPLTAETAVRAANSGHLVLATLHAPVAPAAIQSLLALGVHPHFLAGSLLGCLSQRLTRTLCPECKATFDLGDGPDPFADVRGLLEEGQGHTLCGPVGCPRCLHTGYADRSGVFEVLEVSRAIRRLIVTRQPVQVIREKAVAEGMVEFRQAALLKVARGETSVEEVFRVVPAESLGVLD